MSSPHRLRDLADVQEVAKYIELPPDFAQKLDPYVRQKFVELCSGILDAETEAENIGENQPNQE